jgi:hypothetical protein
MRNIILVVLLLIEAVCVFAQGTSSPAGVGVIREMSGDVQLKFAGSDNFVAARAGSEIAQNTVISTGFKSTAIVVVGGTVITVKPLTRLTLAEIQSTSGTETLSVNLQAGRVRVDVNPPAGMKASTTVQSPSATASVRGTSFELDTLNLSVNEGTVAYSGSFGPTAMVTAGAASYIQINGAPAEPVGTMTESLVPSPPVGTPAIEAPSARGQSLLTWNHQFWNNRNVKVTDTNLGTVKN